MSTSITKGPAFEIRFCEGNKVQVYDLSRRGEQSGNQLLPNEYLEDDVLNGRLRYSKLGNQWLSDDTGTKQHHQQQLATIPDNPSTTTAAAAALTDDRKINNSLDVIPVLAKQKAIEDAKELESIRQGEEAMRKAMERKMKIEMARRARQKAAAEAESSIHLENLAHKDEHDSPQNGSGDKNEYNNRTNGPMNEQDPQHQFEQEKDHPFATEENSRTTKSNQKPSLLHNDDAAPTTPLPNRQQVDNGGSGVHGATATNIITNDHEMNKQHFDTSSSPPPPSFATTAATMERPDRVYSPQSTPNQQYQQQQQPDPRGQQQQQQHVYNSYQPTPQIHHHQHQQQQQQQAAEDSFFHQDPTSNKTKSSSGCCCIIS